MNSGKEGSRHDQISTRTRTRKGNQSPLSNDFSNTVRVSGRAKYQTVTSLRTFGACKGIRIFFLPFASEQFTSMTGLPPSTCGYPALLTTLPNTCWRPLGSPNTLHALHHSMTCFSLCFKNSDRLNSSIFRKLCSFFPVLGLALGQSLPQWFLVILK